MCCLGKGTVMNEPEPVLVMSDLSEELEDEGHLFEIQIYRFEEDETWTLEVLDEEGTSYVWNDSFPSDFAALVEAHKEIRSVGGRAFMDGAQNSTIQV